MARYLICSDIHGNLANFNAACDAAGDIDGVFISGDLQCTEREIVDELHSIYGEALAYRTNFLFYIVAGNCDYSSSFPPLALFSIAGGHTVFMAHGHRYSVPSLWDLENEAENRGADIVIFGHTHNQMTVERDGFTFINPGALKGGYADARFSILDVDDDGSISVEEYEL